MWVVTASSVCLCIITVTGQVPVNTDTTTTKSPVKVSWKVEEFPNPQVDLQACGRSGKQSWVCDPSGILEPRKADEIDMAISRACNATKCDCPNGCQKNCKGYSMAVAMVSKFTIPSASNAHEESKMWGRTLRRSQWDFDEKCGNDVIIVISKKDGEVYTSVGHKAARRLPDECVSEVFYEVKQALRADFGHGLLTMINKYKKHIMNGGCGTGSRTREKDTKTIIKKKSKPSKPISTLALVGIILGSLIGCCLLFWIFCRCCRLWNKYTYGGSASTYTPSKSQGYSRGSSGGGGGRRTTYAGGAVYISGSNHDNCTGGADYSSGGGGGGTYSSGGGGGGTYSSGGGGGGCGSDCGGSDCGGSD